MTANAECKVKEALAFGRGVRQERLKQGLTQRQLADLAGMSLSSLGRIESGKANARLTTVAALGIALRFKAEFSFKEGQ